MLRVSAATATCAVQGDAACHNEVYIATRSSNSSSWHSSMQLKLMVLKAHSTRSSNSKTHGAACPRCLHKQRSAAAVAMGCQCDAHPVCRRSLAHREETEGQQCDKDCRHAPDMIMYAACYSQLICTAYTAWSAEQICIVGPALDTSYPRRVKTCSGSARPVSCRSLASLRRGLRPIGRYAAQQLPSPCCCR